MRSFSPASFLPQTELTSKLDWIQFGALSSQIFRISKDIHYILAADFEMDK